MGVWSAFRRQQNSRFVPPALTRIASKGHVCCAESCLPA